MEPPPYDVLRFIVVQKLADGRLPTSNIPRVWGGAGHGKPCNACDLIIRKTQMMIEGASTDEQRPDLAFHVPCFYFWETVRKSAPPPSP